MRIEVTGPSGQTSAQGGLFEAIEDTVSQEPSKSQWPCSRSVTSHTEGAGEARPGQEAGPCFVVSQLADTHFGEVCAFCGLDVRPPGFVILDYDELGAFCNQECADRKFRLYLDDGMEEDESAPA